MLFIKIQSTRFLRAIAVRVWILLDEYEEL